MINLTYAINNIHEIWYIGLIKSLCIFIFCLLIIMFAIWYERRLIAFMQLRLGPNRAGPFGLLQSLFDGLKLSLKEFIIPKNAIKSIFLIAPIICTLTAFLAWLVIPFGPVVHIGKYNVLLQIWDSQYGILFLLANASIGVYGIFLAGFSSGSVYSLLGGLRSSAQVISYELLMTISIVTVLVLSGDMRLSHIINAQEHVWYIVYLLPSFCLYVISMVGETNRAPFDLPESETELTGGFHTEYSSLIFALFFLSEYLNMFTVSAIAITLFLGGWHPLYPFTSLTYGLFPILWFTIKLILFLSFFIWLRATLPRFRYDQFMSLTWKILIPFAFIWLLVVVLYVKI